MTIDHLMDRHNKNGVNDQFKNKKIILFGRGERYNF